MCALSIDIPAHQALILYGGGGHGKTLIELVRAAGGLHWAGIIDEHLPAGARILEVPVLGGPELLPELRSQGIHLAVNGVGGIGHPQVRQRVFEQLRQAGFDFPPVVHPTAWIESSAELADGVQVLAQSYVGSSAQIGFGTVINAGVVVSHDCLTGQVVNLSPGAMLAGGVHLEEFVQVGMAATINLGLHVGARARIGNSATVKENVPAGTVIHAGEVWPAPRVKPKTFRV